MTHRLDPRHRLIFPGRYKELLLKAHDAGADELMTYKQPGLYFNGTENRAKPAGIKSYFKRENKKWVDYHSLIDRGQEFSLPENCKNIENISPPC